MRRQPSVTRTRGFRVFIAFLLATSLTTATVPAIADDGNPPDIIEVSSVNKNIDPGQKRTFSVLITNYHAGSTFTASGTGLTIRENAIVGDSIRVRVTASATAAAGWRSLTVTNPDGLSDVLADAIFVTGSATGDVAGHVFDDLDGNGVEDGAEVGLSGVSVTVTDINGAAQTVTSDSNGDYTALGVAVGDATVDPATPAGFALTTSNDPQTVTVVEATTVNAAALGYEMVVVPVGDIDGRVFEDLDGNGVEDGAEVGMSGVSVTITDSLGVVQTVSSDSNGDYSATGVATGDATVDPATPSGFALTTANDPQTVTVAEAATSTATPTGYEASGALAPDIIKVLNTDKNIDPGQKRTYQVEILNFVTGATFDAGSGLTIRENRIVGTNIRIRVTAAAVLTPGWRSLTVTNPDGLSDTIANAIFITGGAVGDLTGHIFDDLDGNGIEDGAEVGMSGVSVTVTDINGAALTVSTDSNGDYTATGLAVGVATVDPAKPAGFLLTTANDPQFVTVVEASSVTANPFGFQAGIEPTGDVTGQVFNDLDGNGIKDGAEVGMSGVAVTITDINATTYATTTDSNGDYSVIGVVAGDATADTATPAGFVLTTANDPQTVTVVDAGSVAATAVGYQASSTGSFANVAGVIGIEINHAAGSLCNPPIGSGSAWADYDNDGDQDLYVTDRGGASHLWRNNGDTTGDSLPDFTDVAASFGVSIPGGESLGVVFVDYDNDGDQDLFVTNWAGNFMFQNQLIENGVVSFIDVTATAGIANDGRAITASWGDYDQDGFLDLYLAKHRKCSDDEAQTDALYHANGDGTFTDVTSELCGGVAPSLCNDVNGLGFSAAFVDLDMDGDLDIYLANDDIGGSYSPNRQWRNDGSDGAGGWTWVEVSGTSGSNLSVNSMGLGVGDYDNDGFFDLAFSNILPAKLLNNDGDGTFTDVSVSSGVDAATAPEVTWGTVFFDYNNDSWLDLYIIAGNIGQSSGLPNVFMQNNLDGTFTDISVSSGLDDNGKGRSASIVDFDGDGWVDVFVGNYNGTPRLFHNQAIAEGNTNHYLNVTVQGTESNRDGIGTQLRFTTADGVTRLRQITSGPTHGGGDQKIAFFGIGTHTTGDLTVDWPNGVTETFVGVTVDTVMHLIEPAS